MPIIPTFSREHIGAWIANRPAEPGSRGWGTAMTPGGYHSFEQRWALAQAFDFHLGIGRENVAARIAALTQELKAGLAGIPGVRVITPMSQDVSAGIVCFQIAGDEPEDAASKLRSRGVHVSVAPYATRNLRAGATLLADEPGIRRALEAVRAVSRS